MATEPFDAVLAEMRDRFDDDREAFDEFKVRLAAAHAAEVAERDRVLLGLRAQRLTELAEKNTVIEQERARAEAAERDAKRWQAMREHMVAVDWKPEMGGGPVVMFECLAERIMAGPEGADAIADAAIEFAAIDACMGEKGNA